MIEAERITREESLNNFKTRSMLTGRDVVIMLDRWLLQLKEKGPDVNLSDEGKETLRRIVENMRIHVITTGIPDISTELTGTSYRYVLDWYRDGLQLGIARYEDGATFGEDGTERMPLPVEDSDGDDEDAGAEMPWYMLVHRVNAPYWPIDKWAELNGAQVATARQWASRGRIEARKENGALRVSSIQYTPDAMKSAKGVTYRFKQPMGIPDKLVAKYPILSGQVLDLIVAPNDAAKSGYRLMSIHMDGGTAKAEMADIGQKERDRLINAIYEMTDAAAICDRYYVPPFDQEGDEAPRHLSQLGPATPPIRETMKGALAKGRTECEQDRDESDDKITKQPAVSFEMAIRGAKGGTADVNGRFCRYEVTPETRLLYCIFGWPRMASWIEKALDAIGTNAKVTYPWDGRILIVDSASFSNRAFAAAALATLPENALSALCLEPSLILIDRSTAGQIEAQYGIKLETLGYAYAGDYAYAYAHGKKAFTGFKPCIAGKDGNGKED